MKIMKLLIIVLFAISSQACAFSLFKAKVGGDDQLIKAEVKDMDVTGVKTGEVKGEANLGLINSNKVNNSVNNITNDPKWMFWNNIVNKVLDNLIEIICIILLCGLIELQSKKSSVNIAQFVKNYSDTTDKLVDKVDNVVKVELEIIQLLKEINGIKKNSRK